MALVSAGLYAQILQIFNQTLDSSSAIAQRIATAYQIYATAAQGPHGDPVLLKGIEMQQLKNVLQQIMDHQIPLAGASQQIGLAVMQFWLVPPVMTAVGGVCTAIITPPAVAKLSAIQANSYAESAQTLADALDLATKTVVVTYPPILGPPGTLQ
jgi:hypothetical protein